MDNNIIFTVILTCMISRIKGTDYNRASDGINDITTLVYPPGTTRLFYGNNNFVTLPVGYFDSLLITDILVGQNQISVIEEGCFSLVPNLTRIYLHENRLEVITSGMFANLAKLHSLSFHDNQIWRIESHSFKVKRRPSHHVNKAYQLSPMLRCLIVIII